MNYVGESGWSLMRQFGTSYFWATLLLPHDIQEKTVELYKFVRIPDQIVDCQYDDHSIGRTQEFEDLYNDRNKSYQSGNISHGLFGRWIDIMSSSGIDGGLVESFFQAMRDDLTIKRYLTYEQLQGYMYGSAEVVGLMMCYIIGYDKTFEQATFDGARKLGEAMQLTNFLRDVYEDYIDLDRIYMPSDELIKFHLTHDDVIQFCQTKQIDDRWIGFMKHMIDRCDSLYDQANNTIKYLNPLCQSAIILSSDLYRAILRKIEKQGYNQFAYSTRTTKRDKFKVITKRQLLCKFSVKYCGMVFSK